MDIGVNSWWLICSACLFFQCFGIYQLDFWVIFHGLNEVKMKIQVCSFSKLAYSWFSYINEYGYLCFVVVWKCKQCFTCCERSILNSVTQHIVSSVWIFLFKMRIEVCSFSNLPYYWVWISVQDDNLFLVVQISRLCFSCC